MNEQDKHRALAKAGECVDLIAEPGAEGLRASRYEYARGFVSAMREVEAISFEQWRELMNKASRLKVATDAKSQAQAAALDAQIAEIENEMRAERD